MRTITRIFSRPHLEPNKRTITDSIFYRMRKRSINIFSRIKTQSLIHTSIIVFFIGDNLVDTRTRIMLQEVGKLTLDIHDLD